MVAVSGSRIREARLTAGLTQSQLARRLKTTEGNISRWERGDNEPRVAHIAAIAMVTGRDIDFFLTGSSEADDEEAAAAFTLDSYLRAQVREILAEERELPQL